MSPELAGSAKPDAPPAPSEGPNAKSEGGSSGLVGRREGDQRSGSPHLCHREWGFDQAGAGSQARNGILVHFPNGLVGLAFVVLKWVQKICVGFAGVCAVLYVLS